MTTTIERLVVDLVANNAQFNRELARSTSSAQRWAQSTQRAIKTTAVAFAASVVTGAGADAITAYADAYTTVNNQLRQVTDTQKEFAQANADVFEIAVDTRSNLEAVATLYSRTARNADTLALSQRDVADFTRAINLALQAYGATSQEAASATLQLSQALGSGLLAGQEFLAVSEAAPPIIAAIAEELGREVGELKELASQGEITADVVVQGVLRMREAFEEDFARSIATASSQLEVAATNVTQFVGESERLNAVVNAGAGAVVALSENLDTVARVAEFVAVVYAARLIGPLADSAAAFVAKRVSIAATAVALSSYTGIAATAGATTASLAAASRALQTSMAFLGGTAGILILTAYAMTQVSNSSETTEERFRRLEEEANRLNDALGELTGTARAATIADLTVELVDLEAKLRDARDRAAEVSQNAANIGGGVLGVSGSQITAFAQANADIVELEEQIAITRERLRGLQTDLGDTAGTGAAGAADGVNAELETTIARLEKQVALYGQVGEAAKLRYDIERGAFEGASLEQRNRALEAAAALDARRQSEIDAENREKQAERIRREQAESDRVVSIQTEKFARLRQLALEAQSSEVDIERIRLQAQTDELNADEIRLRERFGRNIQLEQEFEQARQDLKTISEARITEIERQQAEERARVEQEIRDARIAGLQNFLGAVAAASAEGSRVQRAALVAQRLIALNEARIELGRALAKANALGFPQNIGALLQASATGLNAIALIRSVGISGVAHSGLTNVPETGTYLLKQGERAISEEQNKDLTKALRGGGVGGGQVSIAIYSSRDFAVSQEQDPNGDTRVTIRETLRGVVEEDLASGRGVAQSLARHYNVQRRA